MRSDGFCLGPTAKCLVKCAGSLRLLDTGACERSHEFGEGGRLGRSGLPDRPCQLSGGVERERVIGKLHPERCFEPEPQLHLLQAPEANFPYQRGVRCHGLTGPGPAELECDGPRDLDDPGEALVHFFFRFSRGVPRGHVFHRHVASRLVLRSRGLPEQEAAIPVPPTGKKPRPAGPPGPGSPQESLPSAARPGPTGGRHGSGTKRRVRGDPSPGNGIGAGSGIARST